MTKENTKKILPDTSILIDGKLSEMMRGKDVKIIIPGFVMDELESQANRGAEIGFNGLEEVQKLRDMGMDVEIYGRKATAEEIKLAKKGRIDALIREVAAEKGAALYTEDVVQGEVGKAEGLEVVYIEPKEKKRPKLLFEKYFTKNTMSLHMKEGCKIKVKRGKPGSFKLSTIGKKELTEDDMKKFTRNIVGVSRYRDDSSIEMSKNGGEIIQMGEYRIAISKPPFSKDREITIVRPIVKLGLEDYKPSDKLMKRLGEKAEGILISGSPGSGKTTFAQSLADFYNKKGKIVKTMESPRDLTVPKEITQYTGLNGSMFNTSDFLLLVRPDYTVYDEIRKTQDFSVFSDMRMAGVGMVGVVHATDPINSIQRFMGRAELGMIPHILDTIIFIDKGKIEKIFSIELKVKVPTGMTEKDLARPVVEVREFHEDSLEYEIYTFGEENFIVPVEKEKKTERMEELAREKVKEAVKKYDKNPEIKFESGEHITLKIRNEAIPKLIGKEGKNIDKVESKLGLKIDVQPKVETFGERVEFDIGETGKYVTIQLSKDIMGKNANIYIDKEYLFTATVGKNGEIRLKKTSDLGKELIKAVSSKKIIEVFVG